MSADETHFQSLIAALLGGGFMSPQKVSHTLKHIVIVSTRARPRLY